MAKACAIEPTGMCAVLGGDEADVLARLEALDLVPANRNAAGQIVAAGTLSASAGTHWSKPLHDLGTDMSMIECRTPSHSLLTYGGQALSPSSPRAV